MATDRESKRMVSVLYFNRSNGPAYKELAARIRSEGARTIMVWANQFNGPENLIAEARAVIVQDDLPNAKKIAHAYKTLAQDVEVHYADYNGEFAAAHTEEATDVDPEESISTDPVVQDETDDDSGDAEATSGDAVDDRDDAEFFDDAAAEEPAAADESGAAVGESEER